MGIWEVQPFIAAISIMCGSVVMGPEVVSDTVSAHQVTWVTLDN